MSDCGPRRWDAWEAGNATRREPGPGGREFSPGHTGLVRCRDCGLPAQAGSSQPSVLVRTRRHVTDQPSVRPPKRFNQHQFTQDVSRIRIAGTSHRRGSTGGSAVQPAEPLHLAATKHSVWFDSPPVYRSVGAPVRPVHSGAVAFGKPPATPIARNGTRSLPKGVVHAALFRFGATTGTSQLLPMNPRLISPPTCLTAGTFAIFVLDNPWLRPAEPRAWT